MLQQEPLTEQTPSPAERRVTPEELAKALAAVEARKEQSARETEGTIPIGEAMLQLGFDATPEEVWAEVQAQRQAQERLVGRRLPRKAQRRLWLGVGGISLFGLIWISYGMDLQTSIPSDEASTTISTPLQFVAPSHPQTVVKTMAEIPNNGTFYCDTATSQKLLTGNLRHPSQTLVTVGTPPAGSLSDSSWVFTKHQSKIYLHGWMAPRSAAAMQQGNIPIYNEATDNTQIGGMDDSQRITLPIGSFKLNKFDQDDMGNRMVIVSGIHPDQHAQDNW